MRQLCIDLPYNLRVLQKRALCLIYLANPGTIQFHIIILMIMMMMMMMMIIIIIIYYD